MSLGMHRATCVGQRLPNIETGVPSNIQILDLSNNSISTLDYEGFKVIFSDSVYLIYSCILSKNLVALNGSVVARLPLDPRFEGSNMAEDNGIFKGDKNLQHAFLWRGSKTIGPMS
jgi:Leucine-rich repeat (LRR) protein